MDNSIHKPLSKSDYAAVVACAAVPALVLLWGMNPHNPYGYYVFLRFVVFAGAFVFFSIFASYKRETLVLLFIGIAVLYNPFFPVHLSREKWVVLNVITIAVFALGLMSWWASIRKARGAA